MSEEESNKITWEEYKRLIEESEITYNELQEANKEIERLNNIITEVKLCNSDYYNQICTLSSKLSLINIYINERKNGVPKHISDYINKVLLNKTIKLGSDKEK